VYILSRLDFDAKIVLNRIRLSLVGEALKSPALLADLAGLESYIAESYDARSFIELLQNADDAGASRFTIQRTGDFLLVANDGREFTAADFESLCRSAASSKQRGTSIGFRGIGFKSVVGFAKEIHVFSGTLAATFSRELTSKAVPTATRVPLIRIPHPVLPCVVKLLEGPLARMGGDGFKTVFVFGDLIASGIEAEFAAFDATSLLFLRHIRQVEFKASVDAMVTIRRERVNSRTRSVRLASAESVSQWTVIERDDVALAFVHDGAGVARLEERQAVVHAFLPTLESTGFPFKSNGDISTDPSRTRVILDERTNGAIGTVARLIVDLVEECLGGASPEANAKLLAVLIPVSDPRIASFQKRGFKTELFSAIKRTTNGRFDDLLCRPSWLNAADFSKLTEAAGLRCVPRNLGAIEGLASFLRFLGARDAVLKDISVGLNQSAPSMAGAGEIVAHLTALHAMKQLGAGATNPGWNLWPVDGKPLSLDDAKQRRVPLAPDFLAMVAEKGACQADLQRLIASISDAATASALSPTQTVPVAAVNEADSEPGKFVQKFSLKRWRGAEQQVLALLTGMGWQSVEDVSRQNIGYDIEGLTPEGERGFIEVKSLDHPGQTFTLTSNEEVVAREKGAAYRLALVRQTNSHLEVAFIEDPANRLKLTRQCRQWVWECSDYAFVPQRFVLE